MTKPSTLNSSDLIDFIAGKIAHSATWRDGFSDLLEFIGTRLATSSGYVRLYHYIMGRYLEPVSVCRGESDPVVDAVFEQLADERAPVCLPVEYSSYLPGDMQYSVVGIPFVKNGEYLGALVIAGSDGGGMREDQFRELLAFSPYLLPLFESAILQEILLSNYLDAIETLAVALEAKDPFTRGHSNMVTAYAVAIARKIGLNADRLQAIEVGAMMHDIGKIGVPDGILRKPGKLTAREMEVVKRHPVIGEEILAPMQHPLFDIPRLIVRSHHERMDGKGYPDGLRGEEIPFEARIAFISDAFEAMTSERPYRNALTPEQACEELRRNAGTQFDPDLVPVLCDLMAPMIRNEQRASDESLAANLGLDPRFCKSMAGSRKARYKSDS